MRARAGSYSGHAPGCCSTARCGARRGRGDRGCDPPGARDGGSRCASNRHAEARHGERRHERGGGVTRDPTGAVRDPAAGGRWSGSLQRPQRPGAGTARHVDGDRDRGDPVGRCAWQARPVDPGRATRIHTSARCSRSSSGRSCFRASSRSSCERGARSRSSCCAPTARSPGRDRGVERDGRSSP